MDADEAGGLIRVAEWALNRFTERQLAAATGVVVLVYFRGEMRELVRAAFARRSTRKRLGDVEAAVARAEAKLAELTTTTDTLDTKMDLMIQLIRQEPRAGR